MNPLTAPELAEARADIIAALLTDTAVVSRRSSASRDGSGGFLPSYTGVWTGPGRWGPNSAEERELAFRMAFTTAVTITLPATVDVRPEDRVAFGGTTFEVFSILGRRTTELVTRVLAAAVT